MAGLKARTTSEGSADLQVRLLSELLKNVQYSDYCVPFRSVSSASLIVHWPFTAAR
jgi:hypothetical protein